MSLINAFTVDVEDYFQVSAFEKTIARDQWSQYTSRVVANTHRILDLLASRDVKATFFVLGWVADRFPQLVRDIHDAGHEIASHGYEHRLVYNQTPDQFRDDLRRSLIAIEDACGVLPTAYRAPSFSITKKSIWALEILAEEGFRVDSSIYPIYHDRCGIPGAEPKIHRIETAAGPLWEFPPSVARFARLNLPVSGGGYFRLYPLPLTLHCLKRINRAAKQPFMFYVHPWEIDPQQPRLKAGTRVSRFRHRVNLAKTEGKLDVLLRKFRFGRLCDIVGPMASG
jgi:polysaccharide deacetylase family protein (PEP-CTERM system associated)